MTERTEETIKEVTYDSMNIAFIRKTYEKVFNIGDKEASSSAALVPFLTGAVDMLSESRVPTGLCLMVSKFMLNHIIRSHMRIAGHDESVPVRVSAYVFGTHLRTLRIW